ncbi:MAG TPA: helix-turn-helix domain-containing protein [Mycobacteriales bacterium]|nr:helix-turn-helix domain-containing protein [Mycobacteriales bacterium]
MTNSVDLRSEDGRFDVMAAACPTRQVIGRVGDKWSLLVLYALSTGTKRFSQLRTDVEGISQKMLTQTLRALERDGLVHRHAYPTIPPKVEYKLTPLGDSLEDAIAVVRKWAYIHMDEITASRGNYDQQPGAADAG